MVSIERSRFRLMGVGGRRRTSRISREAMKLHPSVPCIFVDKPPGNRANYTQLIIRSFGRLTPALVHRNKLAQLDAEMLFLMRSRLINRNRIKSYKSDFSFDICTVDLHRL